MDKSISGKSERPEIGGLHQTAQQRNSPEMEAIRAEHARQEAQRQLVANVQALLSRVAELEAQLSRLQLCTVQQFADGRLYLPAADKFTVEIPGNFGISCLRVNVTNASAAVTRPLMAGGPPRPCGQVMQTAAQGPPPAAANTAVPGSSSTLQPAVAGSKDWRAIAASNAIDNPLQRRP